MNVLKIIIVVIPLCFIINAPCTSQPVTHLNVIEAFKQGNVHISNRKLREKKNGNCAVTAAIKTAIATFGLNNVFKSVDSSIVDGRKKYIIHFRNGDNHVELTHKEMVEGGKKSFFKQLKLDPLSEQIYNYANFCFAVLARKYQRDYLKRTRLYSDAIDHLNNGSDTRHAHKYLGVNKTEIIPTDVSVLSTNGNIVIVNGVHGVFASQGMYDHYGNPKPLEDFNKNFFAKKCKPCTISHAYSLKQAL